MTWYRNWFNLENYLKNKLANDPIGVLGDVSTVLSLGGGAATKVPMLNRAATVPTKVLGKAVPKAVAGKQVPAVSSMLKKAGDATNPVNIAAKPVVAAGNVGANLISGFGTHTGAMPIKEAFKSGVEGGQRGQAFRENMRGKVPVDQVLEDAKFNLNKMKDAKTDQYNANKSKWATDKSQLSFDGVNKSLNNASKDVVYEGKIIDDYAAQKIKDVVDIVEDWQKSDPAKFHVIYEHIAGRCVEAGPGPRDTGDCHDIEQSREALRVDPQTPAG